MAEVAAAVVEEGLELLLCLDSLGFGRAEAFGPGRPANDDEEEVEDEPVLKPP